MAGWGRVLCHSVMVVVGVTHAVLDRGGILSSHDGGTPSRHGGGTNPHIGWEDTIPGTGWVGVPHPRSRL